MTDSKTPGQARDKLFDILRENGYTYDQAKRISDALPVLAHASTPAVLAHASQQGAGEVSMPVVGYAIFDGQSVYGFEPEESDAKDFCDYYNAHSRPYTHRPLVRKSDAEAAIAAALRGAQTAVPDDVRAAVERMCQPLHESRLSGATAQADARCMALIRRHILGESPPSPTGVQEADHGSR